MKQGYAGPVSIHALVGGTCSGKSTIAKQTIDANAGLVTHIQQDDYQQGLAFPGRTVEPYRNEHPDNFCLEECARLLGQLRLGSVATMPTFDKRRNMPGALRQVEPRPLVLWEGIYAIGDQALRRQVDHATYVETSYDIRVLRRISRYAELLGMADIDAELSSLPALRMFTSVYRAERDFGVRQKAYANDVIPNDIAQVQTAVEQLAACANCYAQSTNLGAAVRERTIGKAVIRLHTAGISIEGESRFLYAVRVDQAASRVACAAFDELDGLSWITSSDVAEASDGAEWPKI